MSSPSSSTTSQLVYDYDVFLSFRGEDTRRTFVAFLYHALTDGSINTYIDNRLQKGTELGPELMKAIKVSRMSIVVFSENYNKSRWCLKELEQIMKCHRNDGQVVLPVFYDVEPSDVRNQKGAYGTALKQTAKKRPSGGEMWRKVLSNWTRDLEEVADKSGWNSKAFENDVKLISEIVEDVRGKLKSRLFNITQYPVGLDTRVQQVTRFINNQSNKVCLIGIWGMGGSGKTTTARAIYNEFHRKFVNHRFIEKTYGKASGKTTIEKIFQSKRALIVLDDVSTFDQVEDLCGNCKCFGAGSVLIVTSRDVNILKKLDVDHVFRIKELDKNKSLELFSWHAFRKPSPTEEFRELSESIADYCGGLPLALTFVGSYLLNRPKQLWESTLSHLITTLSNNVQKKLIISYDGLDEDSERNIFLDICCFFIGKDIAYVTEILKGCGLNADMGITILIERSLLKVENNNKLGMHDLLRDMGRAIVKSSAKKPGERSRLWFHKDVHKVLEKDMGEKTVKGLVLKSPSNRHVSFKADSFKKMKNLKLLQLLHVDLTGGYVHLSQKLRWLHWKGFTGDCIPDEFYQEYLVVFELKHGNIKQVWSETKLMEKLKILNLSHSKYLENTPDFSKLPKLEKLVMKDCPSLSELHPSIVDLKNIQLINLKDCTSLSNLPEKIYQLTSLKSLILSGCSKIDKLEEDIVQLESLTTLIANDTGVKEILYSIQGLKSITYISLSGYEGLSFEIFQSVVWSRMSPTMNYPPCMLPCDYQNKVNFTELETSQNSNSSLRSLLIGMGSYRIVIDTLSKSISQGLASNDSRHFSLLGDNYPSWLEEYTGEGPSALFQVPKNNVKGIILCVAYSSTPKNKGIKCLTSVLIINYTKRTVYNYKPDTILSFNDEDWKNVTSNLGPRDNVQIFVVFEHELIVKKTSVYLIPGQSVTREVDRSIIKEVEPSKEVDMQPSPNMEMEPSEEVCCKRRKLR